MCGHPVVAQSGRNILPAACHIRVVAAGYESRKGAKMDTVSKQASNVAKEARSRKLLSVILTFVLATTLMIPQVAWAEEEGDGGPGAATNVAKIGDKEYATLNEAINDVPAGDPQSAPSEATTITLLKDTNAGFDVGNSNGNAPKNIVIDLAGNTLTLGPAVGSTGTETNGIRVLAYSACEVRNGTVVCSDIQNDQGGYVKMGMANYGTLSLVDVQMKSGDYVQYTINNRGALTLKGSTTVEDGKAAPYVAVTNDPYDYFYTDVDASLSVEGSNVKVGKVLIERYGNNQNKGASINLNIAGGVFGEVAEDGNSVVPVVGNISGGSFSNDVSEYVAEGFSCTLVDGAYVVGETPAPVVAKIGDVEYASLKEAAEHAVAGDVIELLADTESEPVSFADNVTVDLGAKTLTLVGDDAKTVDGLLFAGPGDNVLKNGTVLDARSNGNQTAGWKTVHVSGSANLATEDVAIQAYNPDTDANYNYIVYVGGKDDSAAKAISLGAGTKIENLENSSSENTTYGAVGVSLIGTTANASAVANRVSLTVAEGVSIDTMGYAIAGNGTYHGTDIVINGGDLTSTASAAVYHPQAGTLVLNGGTLEGTTGIQFCSGEGTVNTSFDFNGGVVKGVGEDERPGKTGDGLVSDGAAISLVNRSYPGGAPSITISGGEFSSAHNDAVLAYTWSEGQSSDWAEAAENISIAGGTYSSDVSAYVAEGLACSKIADGVYQVQKKIVDEGGNVEVQAPIVSEDSIPADKPGVSDEEALGTIAGSLGDALTGDDDPAQEGVIGGNKVGTDKGAAINELVAQAKEDGSAVSATMVVTSMPVDETTAAGAEDIKAVVGDGSTISFFDLGVKVVVEKKGADGSGDDSVEASVAETAAPIPFKIKFDELVGKDVKVARYHDGKAELLAGEDVSVDYAAGVVTFHGDKFSTYAVALADSQVTVTFDSKGGSAVEKAEIAKGDLVIEPEAPTRDGYDFGGWYTDETFATAWSFASDRVTGDMTLYAKWTQKATPDVPAVATRLGGDDRYKTMALVSKEAFPEDGSCETVVIARGNEFPDALAASGLAGTLGAQVLITETDELTAETKAEIKRLGAKRAVVLGNEYSISARTFNEIKSLVGGNAERIGGAERFETALEIYKAGKGWGTTAVVATGTKAADSLSISPIAYNLSAPVFLVGEGGSVSQDVLDAIAKGGFDKVLVLGDKYSVSDDSLAQIKKLVSDTERIGGADRYVTSQLTAEWAVEHAGFAYDSVLLTAGRDEKYADALVSSSLGGQGKSPLLLVDEGDLGSVCIEKALAPNKSDVKDAFVLGDKWTVSDTLFDAIKKALA